MNDVRINKEKIGKFIGEPIRKTNDRAYTHEEIKLIIDTCDLRLKVFILLLASTGMRVGAIPSLKLRHLQRLDSLYMLTVYENTKDQYITFCTPEASACSP